MTKLTNSLIIQKARKLEKNIFEQTKMPKLIKNQTFPEIQKFTKFHKVKKFEKIPNLQTI